MVLPEFRKSGFGEQIIKEWMKICENKITFCNDLSLKIFKKLIGMKVLMFQDI